MEAATKPQLPKPKRAGMNPYRNTVDAAMERLASMEACIQKLTVETLRSQARELQAVRRIERKGFAAGSDPVGWHIQNRTGHDWLVKRIALATSAAAGTVFALYIGANDARGLRETFTVAGPFTDPTGVVYSVYSNSFDNDLFVRASEDVFISASASVTGNTILVSLEVEEHVPYKRSLTEDEAWSMAHTPEPTEAQEAIDAATEGPIAIDPDAFELHAQSPEDLALMEEGNLDAGAPPDEGKVLIPDANAHLPAHLKL